jgi:hypothetical protein
VASLGGERGGEYSRELWDSATVRPNSGGAGKKKKGLIDMAHMSAREERGGATVEMHKLE